MKTTTKADLSLLSVTVFWGASFPIMSIALKYIHPYSFVALRNLLGSILIGIIFRKHFKNINKKTIIGAILIGISLFIGSVFQVVGLSFTTPSKCGFITGLNVVFVPVLIAIIYKKLPDFKTILGVIFSMAGLSLMSINGMSGINIGDFLTLLAAISFSAQILLVDKYSKDVDVLLLSCLELFVVGVLSLIPMAFVEHFQITFNSFSIFAIIFTTVFCTAIGMSVQNKMQPLTDPTHAAIIYLAEPVFGAFFSIFIGDTLSGRTLAGCALIFLGMLVLNVKFDYKLKRDERNI